MAHLLLCQAFIIRYLEYSFKIQFFTGVSKLRYVTKYCYLIRLFAHELLISLRMSFSTYKFSSIERLSNTELPMSINSLLSRYLHVKEIIKLFTAATTFYIFKTIIIVNNSLAFWPIMSTLRCHVRLIITGRMSGILKCLCDENLSNVFRLHCKDHPKRQYNLFGRIFLTPLSRGSRYLTITRRRRSEIGE